MESSLEDRAVSYMEGPNMYVRDRLKKIYLQYMRISPYYPFKTPANREKTPAD